MSPKASYCCNAKAHEDYYVNQAASCMPFFAGPQQQKGYGLGGVSASTVRAVLPLVKSGARAIGREALRSGMQFTSDVLEGKNLKPAAVRRAKQAGSNLLKRTIAPPPDLPFFPTPSTKNPNEQAALSFQRRESRNQLKTFSVDAMGTLVHEQSCQSVKSELDLLALPSTQTSLEHGH